MEQATSAAAPTNFIENEIEFAFPFFSSATMKNELLWVMGRRPLCRSTIPLRNSFFLALLQLLCPFCSLIEEKTSVAA